MLAGTLPHLSQQNIFLGIPLVLMPEEVVLLVEEGAAVLIDDPSAHKKPTKDQLKEWNDDQQQNMKSQIASTESKNAKASTGSGRAQSEEAQRKRREREERKKAQQRALESAEDSLHTPSPTNTPSTEQTPPAPAPAEAEASSSSKGAQSSIPYTIVIPAPSSSLEWYRPEANSYTTIEAARAAGVWDYPSNLEERARCAVFRGLWDQGYYMGVGIKFGGEYLVYPGDPLRYHSHFVASVLTSPTSTLRPMEIVAHGRLGTATKKSHLFCGWDDEKKEVSYLSVEWAGFG